MEQNKTTQNEVRPISLPSLQRKYVIVYNLSYSHSLFIKSHLQTSMAQSVELVRSYSVPLSILSARQSGRVGPKQIGD